MDTGTDSVSGGQIWNCANMEDVTEEKDSNKPYFYDKFIWRVMTAVSVIPRVIFRTQWRKMFMIPDGDPSFLNSAKW